MKKLLGVAVAAAFAFGSASGFAQTAAKKQEELTKEERADMRNRAERLRAERAAQPDTRGRAVVGQATTTTSKPAELTREERTEMRNRAERLKAERTAQPTVHEKAAVGGAPKVKKGVKKHKQQAVPSQPKT